MATKKVELRRKNDGTFEEEIVVRSDWDIIDNVPAVFPPEAHTHPVEDIDATGTLNSTTFLRGDGVWSAAGDIIALENAAGDGLIWDAVNNEFDVIKSTTQQAEEGLNDTSFMTPLKVAQAIAALAEAGASVEISATAPANPEEGDLWFDSSTLDLYIFYNDGDSTQWVGIGGGGGSASVDYLTTTIATGNWSGTDPVTAVKTVSGILSTDKPLIDIDLSSVAFANVEAKQTEYAKIFRVAATDDDEITFFATEAPTEELVIQIKVVR